MFKKYRCKRERLNIYSSFVVFRGKKFTHLITSWPEVLFPRSVYIWKYCLIGKNMSDDLIGAFCFCLWTHVLSHHSRAPARRIGVICLPSWLRKAISYSLHLVQWSPFFRCFLLSKLISRIPSVWEQFYVLNCHKAWDSSRILQARSFLQMFQISNSVLWMWVKISFLLCPQSLGFGARWSCLN